MLESSCRRFCFDHRSLASYSMVQKMLIYTFTSSARLTAAYLAEEGIEVVRNIRDNAWMLDCCGINNGINIWFVAGFI